MTLRIISAEQIEYQGEVTKVTMPGVMGSFTVLDHHAAIVAALEAGTVEYADTEGLHTVSIKGGVADVKNNLVSVCIY